MSGLAKKPNILLFIKSLGLGGAERLLVDSLPYLDRTRFNYHVAYLIPWKAMLTPQIVAAGIPIICLGDGKETASAPESPEATEQSVSGGQASKVTEAKSVRAALTLPLAYWRLHQLQQRIGFDLIHADMPVAGILARVVGKQDAIPVVYTEHNLIERYHPLTRWVHGATFGWQDYVLSVSEEVHASIRRSGGDQKTEVRTLLNGVPVDQVRQEAVGLDELRQELEIPEHHTVVGAVAVFRSQKRLEDWLAVAALVAQQQSNVTFLLVGDGPEMAVVRARIAQLGLDGHIRLPGFRSDGRRCIGLMDIFLITSQFEGLPIAMLEAMALGKPVVATAVGGIPEVINNGQEGFLSPYGDVSQLAQQVLTLIQDPELRKRIGQRAASKIEADYHIKFRVQAIEQLYTEVWKSRGQKMLPS